jgi:polysaccharide export outer membrane protein
VAISASGLTVATAGGNSYKIHGGDQLTVNVYGDQSLTGPQTVLPDGTIEMPLVGKVHVGGQSPEEAAQTITYALEKYVRHPVVSVSVTQQGPINVLVLGNVKNPGKYALPPAGSMLTDAIAAAGGVGPVDGPYPDARVAQANGSGVAPVSLEKLLHQGDTTQNVPLQDGQIVYIPSPVTFNVYVAGAVDHPGEIPLNEGDDVAIAIIKAGNSPTAQGDLNNVTVTRTLPDGHKKQFQVDLYKVFEPGGTSRDLPMQKGDIVYVPQIAQRKHPAGVIGQTFFYLTLGLRALFPAGF